MATNIINEPEHDEDTIKKYLEEKFAELIEKVGEGYGQPLQDELFRRLEKTISDFDEDISELLDDLKQRSEKRYEAMKKMWVESDSEEQFEEPGEENSEEPHEISDWERKLEEKAQKSGSAGEDGKKKHGRFSLKHK